jgi:hypothetical protein
MTPNHMTLIYSAQAASVLSERNQMKCKGRHLLQFKGMMNPSLSNGDNQPVCKMAAWLPVW